MGPIDSIVTVSITATSATPQTPNFGVPAILAYHTHNADYIRSYSTLSGMVSDSFTTTEPAYIMATALLSQTPTVPLFKVIRGSTAAAQTCTFKVTDIALGDSVGFDCVGVNGSITHVKRTNPGSETAIQIATAFALLTAPNGTTMSAGGTDTVTVTTTVAGKVVYMYGFLGGQFTDTTASASPATDLNNALTVDTNFYGVAGEHQDATNIQAISVWAEAQKRMHCYTTADYANLGASTGIGATLKAASYSYSFGQYTGTPIGYPGLGIMGQRFTATPGTDTWAYKQIAGATVDNLSATQMTNLDGNNLNYYITVSNVNITKTGINASGIYADLRRGIDALAAQIQVQVYTLLVTLPKLPYDPAGLGMVATEIKSALQQFTASPSQPAALLRNDTGYQPTVSVPAMSTVTTADRGARILRNVQFTAYAQNAVQTVFISGTVNI